MPNPEFKRIGTEFQVWLGRKKIGQAHISLRDNSKVILEAIDIEEKYQRKGYGTLLMRFLAAYLHAIEAKTLVSSNEGSGTVQMLDRVFGRGNVQHFHAGSAISYEKAIEVMDVRYGYTRSEVKLGRD